MRLRQSAAPAVSWPANPAPQSGRAATEFRQLPLRGLCSATGTGFRRGCDRPSIPSPGNGLSSPPGRNAGFGSGSGSAMPRKPLSRAVPHDRAGQSPANRTPWPCCGVESPSSGRQRDSFPKGPFDGGLVEGKFPSRFSGLRSDPPGAGENQPVWPANGGETGVRAGIRPQGSVPHLGAGIGRRRASFPRFLTAQPGGRRKSFCNRHLARAALGWQRPPRTCGDSPRTAALRRTMGDFVGNSRIASLLDEVRSSRRDWVASVVRVDPNVHSGLSAMTSPAAMV